MRNRQVFLAKRFDLNSAKSFASTLDGFKTLMNTRMELAQSKIAHPIIDAHMIGTQEINDIVENKTIASGINPPPMNVSKDENGFIIRRTLVGTAEEYSIAEKHAKDLKQKLRNKKPYKGLRSIEEKITHKLTHMGTEAKERFKDDMMTRIKTPGGFDKLKDISTTNIKAFIVSKRRPFTKQDMINTLQRYKACRDNERRMLANTASLTKRSGMFHSQSQRTSTDYILTDSMYKTQTVGSLLANSNQERRLINYDKITKDWDMKSNLLSRHCKRNGSATLMERSDQYAVKVQEIDQISKNSKPIDNTDGKYQWMFSLRASKLDKNRQVFLPLSTNPLNSCVTARVNPCK